VLRLHRLHFIEKRGMDGVHEFITERGKNVKKDILRTQAEHRDRVKAIKDTKEQELRHALTRGGGSLTVRTKEERDRIEELRQDPFEAREKMTNHMRDLGKSYSEQKSAMVARVSAKPAMNVRPKEELNRIEDLRQDSNEAKEKMAKHMRERALVAREEKARMKERVDASPKKTYWSKEKRDQIEELRQDPDEALAKMTKHMHDRAHSWKVERSEIEERVKTLPAISFRTKEDVEQIEELRQDPDEARAKMTHYMNEQARIDREEKAMMKERVRAQPRKTFWTKEQMQEIEERRQDPDEAREKMRSHMKELARSYKEKVSDMAEKMRTLPRKTFRTPEERDQRGFVESLRQSQTLSLGR